ncbi:MAG: discoidin domain-containing protein, partial [Cyclobacteriaceae bacterium]|nr:discoidin domain-containing protein [Cyclobacteriaceae bacterium]
PRKPGVLYNAMIAPLIPYTLKGTIWYQGESNSKDPVAYRTLFPALIRNWREEWGNDFSFYYVQIAPFHYGNEYSASMVREAQMMTLKEVNTGMAVTMDIGNPYNIHPGNKLDVGHRLALWALNRDYGRKIDYSGPIYKDFSKDGNKIIIEFDHAEEGLKVEGEKLIGFEIAGEDRKFKNALANVVGSMVIVYHPDVDNPQSVRFGFHDDILTNLFDKNNLPASSFRTDDWDIPLEKVEFEPLWMDGRITQLKLRSDNFDIIYSQSNGIEKKEGQYYKEPLTLDEKAVVRAQVVDKMGNRGGEYTFVKKQNIENLKMTKTVNAYEEDRSGGGKNALFDGIESSEPFINSYWQGYKNVNFEATIDLGSVKEIDSIIFRFLRDHVNGVLLPRALTVDTSIDDLNYNPMQISVLNKPVENDSNQIYLIPVVLSEKKARYIKIKIENASNFPQWHWRGNRPVWLMMDEIEIVPFESEEK